MLRLICYSLISILLLAFAAGTRISFDPFSIGFKTPYRALGILFFCIGMAFYSMQSYYDGKAAAYGECKKMLTKVYEDIQKIK